MDSFIFYPFYSIKILNFGADVMFETAGLWDMAVQDGVTCCTFPRFFKHHLQPRPPT